MHNDAHRCGDDHTQAPGYAVCDPEKFHLKILAQLNSALWLDRVKLSLCDTVFFKLFVEQAKREPAGIYRRL
jgi:hypothetical protein